MLTRLRAQTGEESGVSMVELLVVIVLMSVVGSIATAGLVRGMKLSASTQSRFVALAELQKSVDRMSRELRAAAPLQVGGAPVVEAGPHRVVVNTFRNNFSAVRRFTYELCPDQRRLHVRTEGPTTAALAPAGTSPTLNCASPNAPALVDGVNNSGAPVLDTFQYFDSAGAAIQPVAPATVLSATQLAQVKSIKVTVRRALPNTTRTIQVSTTVRLRNAR